jgi:hypothetical protein
MHNAGLRALSASYFARYEPNTTGSAMTGPAIVRELETAAQRCVQKHVAVSGEK